MNRLTREKRTAIVAALVEGNSIRATVRMTGASKDTVTKLLVDLGTACEIHMDRAMRDLTCERIQVDEIWAFVYSKQKNVPANKRGEAGDIWTFVAIDADTKLIPSFFVGPRDLGTAQRLMVDLASRVRGRVQLTTDGFKPYLSAVQVAFRGEVDYAQLVKLYVNTGGATRYSPGRLLSTATVPIIGNPDPAKISTSYIERQNLTMRMSMRRFTRLTNGFSKKAANHAAAVSLHFAHYNFCRVHKSLSGQTPAMAADVSDHIWTLDELIALLEAAEAVPIRRGAYRKTRERKAIERGETISN